MIKSRHLAGRQGQKIGSPGLKWAVLPSAFFAFLLNGCAVGPDYQQPAMVLPATYPNAPTPALKTEDAQPDLEQWWQALHDQKLNDLVEQAIKANLDLEIALDRLQQARTAEAVVLGSALPRGGVSGATAWGTGSTGVRGGVATPLGAATTSTSGLKQINEAAGFDGFWDLDLFGRYRRQLEASQASAEAAAEARNAVLLSVVANVARSYLDMRVLQMEARLLQQEILVAEGSRDFIKLRYEHGLTNGLDLTLAQRELDILLSRLPPLITGISAAQDSIAVLLGQPPAEHDKQISGELPALPSGIEPGLPLDLLRRRPDIREAERQLAASTARIGVAIADLYPHLSFTAAVGIEAQGLGEGNPLASHIWSGGPSASWSVLDFGTLDGLVGIADWQSREQLARYKQTVLNAVREVDVAIGTYSATQDQLTHLSEALSSSQAALALAQERYQRGLTDFLNVIDAQRADYALKDQFVAAQGQAADAFVALFKSLGGGWKNHQTIPDITQPQPAVLAAARHLFADP